MLYEIRDASVSRGGKTILSHLSFEIKGKEKIALVGRNGSGKTTLLELISGKLEADRNDKNPEAGIYQARSFTMGILEQNVKKEDLEKTAEEMMREALLSGKAEEYLYSRERYEEESSYRKIFTDFGFSMEEKGKKLKEFSGGEQKKLLLIGLILAEPELLILDEPTNHLDLETIQWLEHYLKNYPKALLMVSHDRYFIDQTADLIWEISRGKAYRYPGNYTDYRRERGRKYERDLKLYEEQQKEIQRLNDLIERFKHKPKKAAFARSRKKMLERMEKIEKPEKEEAVIHKEEILPEHYGSKWVCQCEHMKIGYDRALKEISFRIRRGQKIGVCGPNGSGKSTFLKTLAGEIPPFAGKLREGNHIDLAYFDQKAADLSSEKNIFDWFHDQFPGLNEKETRQLLAAYLFRGEDLGKSVKSLSGGEKARLKLAALLQTKPNFLILDEPTNNMDIPAKETLESIFASYKGTLLFVSHDRYFLSRLADALLEFDPKREEVLYYPFGYDHYQEQKEKALFGADPAALRRAEEQRMIDELKAVPKKEVHRLKEISTREASLDWRFSLNEEERKKSEEDFKKLLEQEEEALFWEEAGQETEDLRKEAEKKEEEALDAWTKQCLEYYDIYLDSIEE
jgi:ATP-binding cassette, subfamily F, member 3